MKRSPDEKHTETELKHIDDHRVFLDQKRVNVCGNTVKMSNQLLLDEI